MGSFMLPTIHSPNIFPFFTLDSSEKIFFSKANPSL